MNGSQSVETNFFYILLKKSPSCHVLLCADMMGSMQFICASDNGSSQFGLIICLLLEKEALSLVYIV